MSSEFSQSSAAASSARRLSHRGAEDVLRRAVADVASAPSNLAQVLSSYSDPLIAFDRRRRILFVNDAAGRFFRSDPNQLPGQLIDVLLPSRLRRADDSAALTLDGFITVELPSLRADGTEVLTCWTYGGVDVGGAPLFVVVVRERAELDRALDALYASEQRFRMLIEGVRDHAIFLMDAEGHIVSWNSGAERIKGWTESEIIGQPYSVFYTDADRNDRVPSSNLEAAVTEGHKRVEGWRRRKDGSVFYAEGSIWPLFFPDGTLQGFAKVTHDLTARRATAEVEQKLAIERAAREAAEAGRDRLVRLQGIARSLSEVVTTEGAATVILESCQREIGAHAVALYQPSSDPHTLRLFGERGYGARLIPEIVIESFPRGPLFLATADDCVQLFPGYEREIRDGELQATAILPLAGHAGPIGALILRYREAHPFLEEDRTMLLTMAQLSTQALERGRLFQAERHARAEAEFANRAKDEFLAMLGHELRNPLAPIATAVELMNLRNDPGSMRERAIIGRQLEHIIRLVDDLLDVSRVVRGKLDLVLTRVELADVVARSVEVVNALVAQHNHRLLVDVPDGLVVNADVARLTQIVSNLLTNAVRYTPSGGRISITGEQDGAFVVLRVRDNGIGIAPELLNQIFDLFVQGPRTIERAQGGLGIGLAIVRNLVTQHGGTVTAASAGTGQGSEFTIRLPASI